MVPEVHGKGSAESQGVNSPQALPFEDRSGQSHRSTGSDQSGLIKGVRVIDFWSGSKGSEALIFSWPKVGLGAVRVSRCLWPFCPGSICLAVPSM